MTDEQKRLTLQQRDDGKTYTAIAAELGLSSNTVKSFCARSGIQKTTMMKTSVKTLPMEHQTGATVEEPSKAGLLMQLDHSVCRQCGADLHLRNENQMKRFCSERCRQKWWRAHPGLITEKASVSVCAACGHAFKNNGNHARRYCSRACYLRSRFGEGCYGVTVHG